MNGRSEALSRVEVLFRVEHGNPSPEELAVVTAVLLARARARDEGLGPVGLPKAAWSAVWSDQAGSWAAPRQTAWQTAV